MKRKCSERLQRCSFPVISWLFTLLLVLITFRSGAEMSHGLNADGLGVMAVCLAGVSLVRRIMGSRIILTGAEIRVVNPLITYSVPLRLIKSIDSDGTLTITTIDGSEIRSTAFGGSVIDNFVGTTDRAVDRINSQLRRAFPAGGSGLIVKRYTIAWIADVCTACALICGVMAFAVA